MQRGVRAVEAPAGERPDRELGIGAHPRHPAAAELGTHDGEPGVDGVAAVGQAALVARALRGIEPTLRLRGSAPGRRRPPRRAPRPPRCAPSLRAPPASRASARRSRPGRSGRRRGRTARRAAPPGRRLRPAVRTPSPPLPARSPPPLARAGEELRHQVGLGLPQLPTEQLLDQRMVAIPLADRDPAAPGRGWTAPATRAPPPTADSRTASQSGPDSCSSMAVRREEADIVRRQVRQELRSQVVDDEPVVPGEAPRRLALAPWALIDSAARYRPAGQPSVALDQLGELIVRQVHAGRAREAAGLLRVHAQVVRPDLERQPARPQRRRAAAQGRRAPRARAASPRERAGPARRGRRGTADRGARERRRARGRPAVRRSPGLRPGAGRSVASTDAPG